MLLSKKQNQEIKDIFVKMNTEFDKLEKKQQKIIKKYTTKKDKIKTKKVRERIAKL